MQFFKNIWEKINELVGKLNFDGLLQDFIDRFVTPIDELFKWLLLGLLIIIIVLGTISLIKKTFKVFIVLIVIVAIIFAIYSKK